MMVAEKRTPRNRVSAGILLYRRGPEGVEVLLIHPGGPYWRHRGPGAWQLPKGAIEAGESPQDAALREFTEELGTRPPGCPRLLGEVRQAGGKRVIAFALEGDLDPDAIVSNHFDLEWPPRSGRMRSFPEVDLARWAALPEARTFMLASQAPLLDRLEDLLAEDTQDATLASR